MFKNRVRTAALAGAIAVATGVSGLSVPAYAAPENPQTENHFNQPDGSKAGNGSELQNLPATGQVKAADVLTKRANDDKKAINAHKFQSFSYIEARPVEQESFAAAKAKEAEAKALLERSLKTLDDASATLKAVEAETKTAENAWKKYATAVTLTPSEKLALLELADDLKVEQYATGGDYQNLKALINAIPVVQSKPGDADYVAEVRNKSEESIAAILAFDESARFYMETQKKTPWDIDASNAASTLYTALFGYLEDWDGRNALYRDAIQKTSVATSRNIVQIREAFERAQKNVRAARTLEAYYGVAARWLDLYENDALRENEVNTVRDEFFNVLFRPGIEDYRVGQGQRTLYSLDQLASLAQQEVDSDLKWENPVQRIRLMDKKYTSNGAEKTDINASLDRIANSLAALEKDKATAPKPDNNAGNKPADNAGNKPADNAGNKPAKDDQGLKIFGIIAGVIAAIAALAGLANLPQVKALLKF